MMENLGLLSIIYCCFGELIDIYSVMNSSFILNISDFIFITLLSFLISSILHNFSNKIDFKISNDNQIEVIETKKYSLLTKMIVVFFILILISTPFFKFLNSGYFL